MAEECGCCNTKANRNSVRCSGLCQKYFHPNCVDISNENVKLLSSIRNFKWFCENCVKYFETDNNTKLEIDDLRSAVNKNFEEIRKMLGSDKNHNNVNNNLETKKSYAEVTGEVVVIKPKKVQESKTTKEVIRKALNPSKLEVGITQIKDTKEGGVLLKCKSKDEIEKIKQEAEKKLKKNYEITIPKQKNPHIKIVDLEDEMDTKSLEECILKQNSCLNQHHPELQVKVTKKMKSKYMAIIECDPVSADAILKQGKISIGWSICRVFEYVPVFRCFKCGDYDHKATDCKKEERCLKCSSKEHKSADCGSDNFKCSNCMEANEKLKLNLKIDHTVFDVNCPVYLRKVSAQKRSIKVIRDE